jgi:2-octaprenyl-6-methoxyphenol hydroxylase
VAVEFDVLIVGSGMVGASLACALAGGALRVVTVEPVEASAPAQPSYDDRVVALSRGSQRILHAVGVWGALPEEATPIQAVHVSDRGHFGAARLAAGPLGVEALGYVVEARALGAALLARLQAPDGPQRLCPARVVAVTPAEDAATVRLEAGGVVREVRARLVVAADGGRSGVRDGLGIAADERPYGQTAVIANLSPERAHRGVAYERFTESGPLALLPMRGGRCGLVWTVPSPDAERVLGLDDAAFLAVLQDRFGDRLGRFTRVGRRSAYPLSLVRAREQVRRRVAVIGNAAHTLHPVAGQGFNLGLRDAAALAQLVVDAARAGSDPGASSVLEAYARWRRADQAEVTLFTDSVVRLFSNRSPLLAAARNTGLLALDLLPGLKGELAWRMMGLAGRQSRLACGVPL